MLVQSSQLIGGRVMSLHTGVAIAQLGDAIINPHKLVIVGFYIQDQRQRDEPTVLLTQDIREAGPGRILIDSNDEITPLSQLVRLQAVSKLKFNLAGKPVRTTGKQHLGKVEEYIIDTLNFEIQKLYVKQPLLKSFASQTLVIDRSQIIEVSDRQITVEDTVMVKPATVPAALAD